jgi:hypothetical protein
MNQGNDLTGAETEISDEGARLNPQEAAALFEETKRQAERQFDVWPPFLLLIGAVIFLLAFGSAWWSVRGQNPYVGPSGWALAVMYGGILAWIVVVSLVVQRAISGISGPSVRSRKYRAGYMFILVAYSLFQGALYHAGASHAIVYGIFPASAPWLFAGTVFLTLGAIREEGRALALGIVLIAIGIGGAFAGPVAAWLVSGIGLSVVLVGFATVQFLRRRA